MQQDSLKQNKITCNDPKWKRPYFDKRVPETILLTWKQYPIQNNV